MADTTQLRTTLEHLRKVSHALARQIEFEMTRLEATGIAPSSKTLSTIHEFRSSVRALGQAVAPRANLDTLADIETALVARGANDVRARVLDPIIALAHTENPAFPPLDDLQKAAVRLEGEIHRNTASTGTLAELASGAHPWCKLLELTVKGHDLGDAVWGEYYDAVEAALGRQMAIAATRGKLKLPANFARVVIGEALPGPPRDAAGSFATHRAPSSRPSRPTLPLRGIAASAA